MIRTEKIIQCDTPSPLTGRIYRKDTLEFAAAEYMLGDPLFGMLNSYDTLDIGGGTDLRKIQLDKVSHKVIKMYVEDSWLKADIEILKTPMGNILSQLLDADVPMNLSFAGTGILDDAVVSEFSLLHTFWVPGNLLKQHGEQVNLG